MTHHASQPTSRVARRVMAIVLPDLACELALCEKQCRNLPLATIGTSQDTAGPAKGDVLEGVNLAARALGIRSGQTVAEARAIAAHLVVRSVTSSHRIAALGRLAEVALAFGSPVAIRAEDALSSLGIVWVDITRTAHLHGGEEATMIELSARLVDFGHRMRIGIADGPRLARAAAVYGADSETRVPPGEGRALMAPFPLEALSLAREHIVWLNRLGLWTVGEITALAPEAVGSRLGATWSDARALALGVDDVPLVAYEAARTPSETAEWEDGVASVEPLLFTLRALTSRLSARLRGRGEAVQTLELWAPYDLGIAALRGVQGSGADATSRPGLHFRIELPTPLAGQEDLFRVLKSKLEHTRLEAPARALTITARRLTEASPVQLSLRGQSTTDADPKALAVLLAELSSEIGSAHVGVLEVAAVHRPEGRTKLMPIVGFSEPDHAEANEASESSDAQFPTRLLQTPLRIASVPRHGETLAIEHHLFTIARVRHAMRIDQVEWWTPEPVCRDYLRVWLTSGRKNVEAWVYTDRRTGRAYLHGFFD